MRSENTPNLAQNFFIRIRRIIYSIFGLFSNPAPVVVYCYHSISDSDWRFSISLEYFQKQVQRLLKSAQPISVDQLKAFLDHKLRLNGPAFILTFDDGYRDLMPIKDYLPALGIRPIVFVLARPEQANRGELSTLQPFLSNTEILSLHEAGWDIGCHSATHADFATLNKDQIEAEISEAKQILERELNIPIKYFAYPKGKYNPELSEAVRRAGFVFGFSMDHEFLTSNSDPVTLPRVGVDHTHTMGEFRGMGTRLAIRAKKIIARHLPKEVYD